MATIDFHARGLKGYKTENGARVALAKASWAWEGCQSLIATQGGEFFPLVIKRDSVSINIPYLCSHRIMVAN